MTNLETATLAGGCSGVWEAVFDDVEGVRTMCCPATWAATTMIRVTGRFAVAPPERAKSFRWSSQRSVSRLLAALLCHSTHHIGSPEEETAGAVSFGNRYAFAERARCCARGSSPILRARVWNDPHHRHGSGRGHRVLPGRGYHQECFKRNHIRLLRQAVNKEQDQLRVFGG